MSFCSIAFLGASFMGEKVEAAEMNFSVVATLPDNQVTRDHSYFDLKMKPGQEQQLEVVMKNDTDTEVTIEVEANTAITNDNGIVDYSQSKPALDKSMVTPFSKIATTEPEVKVPAHSEKVTKIAVKMPAESYDGVILGGLHFIEKETDAEKKESKGVQIKNRFAYVIGVSLNETDKVVTPKLQLNSVEAGQVNYRNAVKANIQNPTATIIKGLKINGSVTKKGSKKVLHQTTKENLRIAPNTNFNFAIDWENKEFTPGTYVAKYVATSGADKWEWEKEFTIKGETANKLNKKAVDLEKDYTRYYIYIIIGIVLLFLLILALVIYRMKKAMKRMEKKAGKQRPVQKKSTPKKRPTKTISKKKSK